MYIHTYAHTNTYTHTRIGVRLPRRRAEHVARADGLALPIIRYVDYTMLAEYTLI